MAKLYKGARGFKQALDDIEKAVTSNSSHIKQNKLLANEFVKYNNQYVAKDTGYLRGTIKRNTMYDKALIRAKAPYASYIYFGKSKSGKPLNYKEPTAKPKYFEYTWEQDREKIKKSYIAYMNKII